MGGPKRLYSRLCDQLCELLIYAACLYMEKFTLQWLTSITSSQDGMVYKYRELTYFCPWLKIRSVLG